MSEKRMKEVRRKLIGSADRLKKFLALKVPDEYVAREIAMLVQLALALDPEAMGKALGKTLGVAARNRWGVCEDCGIDLKGEISRCEDCQRRFEAEHGNE